MFFPLALSFFLLQEDPGTEGFNTLMDDYFGCAVQSAILFFCFFFCFFFFAVTFIVDRFTRPGKSNLGNSGTWKGTILL